MISFAKSAFMQGCQIIAGPKWDKASYKMYIYDLMYI